MSNNDDLDDVFGPLRSTATKAELADEAVTVDAMAHAHIASKGRITMLNSRKARVATLIAAGIIGFGGVAAAGPGGLSQTLELPEVVPVETTIATTVPDKNEEQEEQEEPEEGEKPESQVSPASEEETVPAKEDPQDLPAEEASAEEAVPYDEEAAIAFVEANCVEGNHGKTVSAVAKGESLKDEAGDDVAGEPTPEVEVHVRDAAHSNCGKPDAEHGDVIEAEDADVEDEKHKSDDDGDSDHDDDDGDGRDDDDDGDESSEKAEKPAKKNGNSASKDKGGNGRGKNPKGD